MGGGDAEHCPPGRCMSTRDGVVHLCMLTKVKGHSLLIIKIPLWVTCKKEQLHFKKDG